ncbi:histidine phosphatase family protein [Paenibacillus motobuensis]|nr:histidine phosphatase family protein [Paenibacillus lutimineralis]MCM3645886.1 histidine phosphatase family protein [Paenibacillus motobuensis]
MERTKGLSERGRLDACKAKEILRNEEIDFFISSPYERENKK